MRAVTYHRYGDPSVLRVEDVPEPHAGPGQIRIRVAAAGVNPIDWKLRAGYLHEMFPLQFPKIPGRDAAGVVDEVGAGVTGIATAPDDPTPDSLVEAATLGAAGSYVPYVEASYALDQIAEAHARSQAGHARGKLVIRL